ncbi:MAG: glycosyltransferase, partial [Gammaproteobacteria bacterium]|nr:glycosyltransferase [Gammaproteobacteria bacterium]
MILIDHYEVFQYIPDTYKGVIVLHEHNAEYVMWERFARAGTNPLERMVCYLESQRVRKYEAQACDRADLVFAAPNDIDKLAEIGVDRNKCRVTYHLGDDTQLELPALQFEDTEKSLLNVSSLTWEANIDGLLWFIKSTWPLLKMQHPDLKFYIVGKDPDPRLIAVASEESGIILTGFVEDLEAYYRRSRVFIAPLRFGSGIKVKIVNAMCRGIPTVTTSVGTEGLAIKNMQHLAIADNSEQQAEAIDTLLTDQDKW